jgi:hypothetical protein
MSETLRRPSTQLAPFAFTVPNHMNLRKRFAVPRGKTSHAPYVLYYWYPGGWRGYMREYTRGDCIELANALGLELVELRGVHHMLFRLRRWLRPLISCGTSRRAPACPNTDLQARSTATPANRGPSDHRVLRLGRQPLDRTPNQLDHQEIRTCRPLLPHRPNQSPATISSPLPIRYPTT